MALHIIELTRSDLNRENESKLIEEISVFDFKDSSMTRKEMARAHFITFIDDDKSKKILKSRY